ncbi:hypothetical protein LIA77_11310 [Sarocladium implicatum]|nr:hypothetical protein LIA77_11310 [Sarocladium implicatum]
MSGALAWFKRISRRISTKPFGDTGHDFPFERRWFLGDVLHWMSGVFGLYSRCLCWSFDIYPSGGMFGNVRCLLRLLYARRDFSMPKN